MQYNSTYNNVQMYAALNAYCLCIHTISHMHIGIIYNWWSMFYTYPILHGGGWWRRRGNVLLLMSTTTCIVCTTTTCIVCTTTTAVTGCTAGIWWARLIRKILTMCLRHVCSICIVGRRYSGVVRVGIWLRLRLRMIRAWREHVLRGGVRWRVLLRCRVWCRGCCICLTTITASTTCTSSSTACSSWGSWGWRGCATTHCTKMI